MYFTLKHLSERLEKRSLNIFKKLKNYVIRDLDITFEKTFKSVQNFNLMFNKTLWKYNAFETIIKR